jgi:predicted nuclease of predicted toxin-antitoxin system
MRFKIDENLPNDVATVLTRSGHDVATVHGQGLVGAGDDTIGDISQREGRVLVTLDLDFADIRTFRSEQFPGLVVIRARIQEARHVLKIVERLIPMLGREPLEGSLWVVDETGVRIRGPETRGE